MVERVKICPLCGSNSLSETNVARDNICGQIGSMNYLCCNNCHNEISPITVKKTDLKKIRENLQSNQTNSNKIHKKEQHSQKYAKANFLVKIFTFVIFIILSYLYNHLIYSFAATIIMILLIHNRWDELRTIFSKK